VIITFETKKMDSEINEESDDLLDFFNNLSISSGEELKEDNDDDDDDEYELAHFFSDETQEKQEEKPISSKQIQNKILTTQNNNVSDKSYTHSKQKDIMDIVYFLNILRDKQISQKQKLDKIRNDIQQDQQNISHCPLPASLVLSNLSN